MTHANDNISPQAETDDEAIDRLLWEFKLSRMKDKGELS